MTIVKLEFDGYLTTKERLFLFFLKILENMPLGLYGMRVL